MVYTMMQGLQFCGLRREGFSASVDRAEQKAVMVSLSNHGALA